MFTQQIPTKNRCLINFAAIMINYLFFKSEYGIDLRFYTAFLEFSVLSGFSTACRKITLKVRVGVVWPTMICIITIL